MQHQSISLPNHLPSPVQLGNGAAVFHPSYSPDNLNRLTFRRYILIKSWDSTLPVMCLFGMNPSNASSCSNDPTVEFMMKVAKSNGCGSLSVVNTSPYIKSSNTKRHDFVVDNEGWEYIQFAVQQASLVVLAWGENGQRFGIPILNSNYTLRSLLAANLEKLRVFEFGGLNSTLKFPKHPLQRTPFKEDHRLLHLTLDEFNDIIHRIE